MQLHSQIWVRLPAGEVAAGVAAWLVAGPLRWMAALGGAEDVVGSREAGAAARASLAWSQEVELARAGRTSVPRVRTLMGRLMIARPLGRQADLAMFTAASAAGESDWTDDDAAVAQAACELAVRRYFPPGYDVSAVTALATWLRDVTDDELTSDLLAVEALIREALGEPDVDVTGITPATRIMVHIVVFDTIARGHLGGDERVVTEMMARAERKAWQRGWNPRRATS